MPLFRDLPSLRRLLSGLALLWAAQVQAGSLVIDLPAQSLAESLQQLAAQAGLTLAADSAVLAGRDAPTVQGHYEIDAALERLLAGTGLVAVREGNLIVITAVLPVPTLAPAVAEQAHAVVELPPLIVGGELLVRPLERTPSSVAVYTGGEIARSTVRDLYALIAATPNASLDDSDYGFAGMTLRGINGYGSSGAGGFAVYSTTSTVVLDGVGLPRSALGNVDLSAFDLSSVEILRGPQSTSQGRNAMAGAVLVDTGLPEVAPGFETRLRGRLGGGSEGGWQAAAALDATLWPDRLAVRLVTDQRGDDGDLFNVTRGEADWAGRRSGSTRLRAHWTPDGPDGRYRAVLSAADLRLDQGSRYVLAREEYTRLALSDAPQDYDNHSRLVSLEQRLRLGDRWGLRAISAYIDAQTRSRFDLDYGPESQGETLQWEDARAFSQELRLEYAGARVRGSAGLYYFDGHDGDASHSRVELNAMLDAAGACGLQIVCSLPLGNLMTSGTLPARVEDLALFGELDWALTPRLTLTTGLRYDRERNGRVMTTEVRGDQPAGQLAVALLRGLGVVPADGTTEVSRSFSAWLPKLALLYEWHDGWFLGAAYAEGYRPGGDGYNQVSGRRFSFDAERTRNVELSLKGRHAPWRLWLALNLFGTRWEDMQVQGGRGTDTYLENAGLADVRGGELELRWRALDALQVVGGYGVTRGRFRTFVTTEGEDLSGYHLPKAPTSSGTLALEWSPGAGLLVRPEVLWTGATPANPDNRPEHALFSHHLLNLSLRWQQGPLTLFLSGTNLADRHYRRDANGFSLFGIDVVSLGDRRRLFGGVEFEF